MTDFRALCIELTDCLEKADWPLRYRYVFRQWVDIARAALADEPAVPDGREPASVTGQPSDEELLELWQGWNLGWDPQKGMVLMPHPAEYARAVLARWGHQPAPPAEGEVAELVAWLREIAQLWEPDAPRAKQLFRAADLLERLAPQPPSLAEQALAALSRADKDALTNPLTGEVVALRTILSKEQSNTIRRALERLQHLEQESNDN